MRLPELDSLLKQTIFVHIHICVCVYTHTQVHTHKGTHTPTLKIVKPMGQLQDRR